MKNTSIDRMQWTCSMGSRLSNLTPLDYFLWRYVKDIAYSKHPITRDYMIAQITIKLENIPSEILKKPMDYFIHQTHLCCRV